MRADLVLLDVEVAGSRVDVTIRDGVIHGIDERTTTRADAIDGRGGALVPGLWDHHIHLLALAAARNSVDVSAGSEAVGGRAAMQTSLRQAHASLPPGAWIRAVGYHESVAGELDRATLDAMVAERPVRVQHRSGAMWVLNSAACAAVGSDELSGRFIGDDAWLRSRLPTEAPDLTAVGRMLSGFGVTGATDMTPSDDASAWDVLATACAGGDLPQRIVVTGGPELTHRPVPEPLARGPVKLYLADHRLPALDDLVDQVTDARAAGRTVAFHSVTRSSLVLALTAMDAADPRPGDRIEHGAVVPPELADHVRRVGMTVVTQPGFLADRGDRYLADVDAVDQPHLYPCAGLIERGIPVAGSSDAPFGPADPWQAIAAATERRSASGRRVGSDDPVDARRALDLFLGPHDDPGGPPRTVAVGAPADLCLLRSTLDGALREPSSDHVRATIVGGRVSHESS